MAFPGLSHRMVRRTVATSVVAGMALVFPAAGMGAAWAGAATLAKASLPSACPTAALVQAKLGHKVTKTDSVKITSGGEQVRTCGYKTSFKVPTIIVFATPISHTKFLAARKAESKKAHIVVLSDLGSSAWALKAGGGLAVLRGTLEFAVSAPHTSDPRLEALAHKIIADLPRS